MLETILVINSGSSSIKFSLFNCLKLSLVYHGEIENISICPQMAVFDHQDAIVLKKEIALVGHKDSLEGLFDWLTQVRTNHNLKAVGHRVVHGGSEYLEPVIISDAIIKKLESLNPLAPLHQPHNIEAIKILQNLFPELLQVACFDTTFHSTQHKLSKLFALPRALTEEGIIRYGFHGISYEYIASVLPNYIKDKANGKVIVAHLGHGASMCAMQNRKSVATSMGFTALDGLVMGTRCGSIDPGVILYLLQEKNLTIEMVGSILYESSGLLGVSGISSDMRELQSSKAISAIEAVDLFCYRAVQEIGALCAVLQGCDALIFTAGIGEKSSVVRKIICDQLGWLGLVLDDEANLRHDSIINDLSSDILVGVIVTNEEQMIAQHVRDLIMST